MEVCQPSSGLGKRWRAWSKAIAAFLHRSGQRGPEWEALPRYAPATVILLCGCAYGAVMASYHGLTGDRAWMVCYGALKVPMLFLVTMLTAVPCFYVLNLLAQAGDDFHLVWRALNDYQLSVALQLLALAPATLFVNLTNGDYRTAQAWNTLLFGATAWNARRSLLACYLPLARRRPVHNKLRRFWFLLYSFIGVQMAWDLRPFVGHPTMPVQFFREDIGNAYVEVARLCAMYFKGWWA